MSVDIMKQLQEPFPPQDIEWRVGSTNADKTKGIALAYVTNRAIMNRLDDIFGPFGWKNEFKEWKGTSQLCGISVLWGGEWITKWDGADDSQTEAVKGGLSDAMKRAGYQWGIGRYLYNLENQWVDIVPAGRSYRLKSEPTLPDWALPEDFRRVKSSTSAQESKQEPKQEPKEEPLDVEKPVDEPKAKVLYAKMRAAKYKKYDEVNEFLGYEIKTTREVKLKDFKKLADWLDTKKVGTN